MLNLFPNVKWMELVEATGETFYMTLIALTGTFILGIILGLLLYLTSPDGIWENKLIHFIVSALVNIFRRSEEHTSELQSRGHLVCRLLLEKKKDKRKM